VEDHSIEVNIAVNEIGCPEKRMSLLKSISILYILAAIVKRRFFSQVFVVNTNSIQGIL
jgi:hypothetical protein